MEMASHRTWEKQYCPLFTRCRTPMSELAQNGGVAESAMKRSTPAAQQSTGVEYSSPLTTSGATVSGEPRRLLKCRPEELCSFANPKSQSLYVPTSIGDSRSSSSTFSHFTSRWTMLRLCRNASARIRCRSTLAAATSGKPVPCLAARSVIMSKRSPALQHSMTRETMPTSSNTSCIATMCLCFRRRCMRISPSNSASPKRFRTSRGCSLAFEMRFTARRLSSPPRTTFLRRQFQTRPKLPSPMGSSPTIS
mmetsp:Transcript_81853/g.210862  ORF Transcript_81853/g.210862 Transcript_81853/m.210862 type:complete len:251 (+) Transcript_81853:242-994(+)